MKLDKLKTYGGIVGKFVELQNYDVVKYEGLTDKPFGKILALQHILKFYRFQYFGPVKSSETFYDTPNDILNKAGIVLSRIQEDDRVFFKVAQSSNLKASSQRVFSHKVGIKDTIKDHAFYLVDGIKSIFSTPIYIDLENVLKNVVPKVSIFINANVYKVISGSGFRAYLCLEEIRYENYETKRQHKSNGMTVKLAGPSQYLTEFKAFNDSIKKYCKEFIEVHDNIYEHAKILTKKIDAKQIKLDKKKAKEKIANANLDN